MTWNNPLAVMSTLATGRPRPTAGRQLRAAGLIILVVGGLLGVAYGVFWLTVGRPVLRGEHHHDFGVVELVGGPVRLEHTFRLTNRRSQRVEIREIKTTCGCAVASSSADALEPGETIEIAATLSLRQDGRKEARIFLDCGDHGVEVLRVQAAARNHERLIVPAGRARVEAGASVERVVLFYDYETNDEPPRPRLTAPAGVRAELGPWTLERKRRPAKGLPARWRGTLRIESLEDTLPDDAAILIAVGPDHKVTVPITNNQ